VFVPPGFLRRPPRRRRQGDLAGAFTDTGVVTVKPAVALPGKSALGTGPFFFQLTFDVAGRIVADLVTILFAVPSSGGVYLAQTLPRFFRFLGDWLPLRRMTDGGRSLTFFNGNGAAGLDTAIWVLAFYLVLFTLLTLLVVWRRRVRELRAPVGATQSDS
jgi:hypothetical protein